MQETIFKVFPSSSLPVFVFTFDLLTSLSDSMFSQFQGFHKKLKETLNANSDSLCYSIIHHHLCCSQSQRLVLGKVSKSLKPARKWLKLPFLFSPGNRILDTCAVPESVQGFWTHILVHSQILQEIGFWTHALYQKDAHYTTLVTPSICDIYSLSIYSFQVYLVSWFSYTKQWILEHKL